MMRTVTELSVEPATSLPVSRTLVAIVNRWIFVFMSALFVATALVGFIPSTLGKLAEAQAGQRPPLPLVLHLHAVLMASWLLLLLAQSVLMATGHRRMHRQLGIAAMVVALAMIIAGIVLVPTMFHYNWARSTLDAARGVISSDVLEGYRNSLRSIFAAEIAAGLMFAVLVALGLRARMTDSGMHRRLMILATVVLMTAAVDRIPWLPSTLTYHSILSPYLYVVLLMAPMLIWDLSRYRRLHPAYVVWFAVFAPTATIVINLWESPWWMATVQTWMGVR